MEQELLTLPAHQSSPIFSGVRFALYKKKPTKKEEPFII
jgi:hypothetical protein